SNLRGAVDTGFLLALILERGARTRRRSSSRGLPLRRGRLPRGPGRWAGRGGVDTSTREHERPPRKLESGRRRAKLLARAPQAGGHGTQGDLQDRRDLRRGKPLDLIQRKYRHQILGHLPEYPLEQLQRNLALVHDAGGAARVRTRV